MGNNCVCLTKLNESENPEIYTPSKIEFDPITSSFYNKTFENVPAYVGKEIEAKTRAAAANRLSPIPINQDNFHFLEEMKSFEVKSSEGALALDAKVHDNPPFLRDSLMEFAMDLFDEINKLRENPDLFVDLMEKHPSLVVSKEYNKKAGFEIGWSSTLYDLLDDYLNNNKDEKVGSAFRNKANELLGKNNLCDFDFTVKELNLEKTICELIGNFYFRHKEIFQVDYAIGAIGIVSLEDSYRIVLILG